MKQGGWGMQIPQQVIPMDRVGGGSFARADSGGSVAISSASEEEGWGSGLPLPDSAIGSPAGTLRPPPH